MALTEDYRTVSIGQGFADGYLVDPDGSTDIVSRDVMSAGYVDPTIGKYTDSPSRSEVLGPRIVPKTIVRAGEDVEITLRERVLDATMDAKGAVIGGLVGAAMYTGVNAEAIMDMVADYTMTPSAGYVAIGVSLLGAIGASAMVGNMLENIGRNYSENQSLDRAL